MHPPCGWGTDRHAGHGEDAAMIGRSWWRCGHVGRPTLGMRCPHRVRPRR